MHKSVKNSIPEEGQMSNSKENLLELNSSSEDKRSSAEPSANGAETESQDKAAAGSNLIQTQISIKL